MRKSEKAGNVVQLIVFRLKDGVTHEQFLATTGPTTELAIKQPGCIADELLYDRETDRWIDIVWWETEKQARDAEEVFNTADVFPPMFALIDMETAEITYNTFVQGYS